MAHPDRDFGGGHGAGGFAGGGFDGGFGRGRGRSMLRIFICGNEAVVILCSVCFSCSTPSRPMLSRQHVVIVILTTLPLHDSAPALRMALPLRGLAPSLSLFPCLLLEQCLPKRRESAGSVARPLAGTARIKLPNSR